MAIIKPTFSLTSNAETASTDAGPMSIALSLSTTLDATVDLVEQRLITTSTTLNADSSSGPAGLIDGSALATLSGADSDGDDNVTAGTVGGYVYMKNMSSTAAELIYIGIVTAGGNQASAVPAASGTTSLDADTHESLRTFTLKAGDFAWFPWDYVGDIHWESATGTPLLEMWIFDRSAA